MARAIWIVFGIHTWLPVKVNILAPNLAIVPQLLELLVADNELPFPVGNRDSVNVANLKIRQPW